ncbi:beta-amyrin 11-oxidase-like [Gossypium arboreum]|uniref:beta-amyrin 11-oxidase-like n=1 Tax=Gossypium arboreum TaxID=29729 RepID=UPI0022F146BE|nr:beta-amyrin 11-oxidase-like [Gossypium arboreum]
MGAALFELSEPFILPLLMAFSISSLDITIFTKSFVALLTSIRAVEQRVGEWWVGLTEVMGQKRRQRGGKLGFWVIGWVLGLKWDLGVGLGLLGIIDFLEKADYEDGRPMSHELLAVLLIGLFIAGRETTSRAAIWATIYLHNHPHLLHKAKEEKEEIVKRRPSSQKGLTFTEIKQMKYLSKDFIPKAGAFLPFSTGSSTCPRADLAKLEVTIFLHYFLLNYKLVQLNPGGPVNYFPSLDPVDNCPAKIIKIR